VRIFLRLTDTEDENHPLANAEASGGGVQGSLLGRTTLDQLSPASFGHTNGSDPDREAVSHITALH
jgi:hypothetical protein